MEKMTRGPDGRIRCSGLVFMTAEEACAWLLRELGPLRMNRTERAHGRGYVFTEARRRYLAERSAERGWPTARARLLGIVAGAYCWSVELPDTGWMDDVEYDDWLDWLLMRDSGGLVTVGRKSGLGRTSARYGKENRRRR